MKVFSYYMSPLSVSSPLIPWCCFLLPLSAVCCRLKSLCDRFHPSLLLCQPHPTCTTTSPYCPPPPHHPSLPLIFPCRCGSAHTLSLTRQTTDRNRFSCPWSRLATRSNTHLCLSIHTPQNPTLHLKQESLVLG